MDYKIFPPEELIDVEINLPFSKSVVNRLLIMRSLAGAPLPTIYKGVSDDIDMLYKGLETCGNNLVDIGAAGTAMRFLTAYYSLQPGLELTLTGTERMCKRPIAKLIDALRTLGAQIEYVEEEGFPPIKITGRNLEGGHVSIDSSVSSQYITALMLIAPYLNEGLKLTLEGNTTSKPYIEMTARLMERHGAEVDIDGNKVTILPGKYSFDGDDQEAEPDWSAASYWAQIVALSAGFVQIPGLSTDSVQGDRRIKELFLPLGVDIEDSDEFEGVEIHANPEVHSRLDLDMSDNPDIAQTLAVTCILLNIPFKLSGLSTLAIKETHRIDALKKEFLKLGCITESYNDEILEWEGKRYPLTEIPEIDTYDDHRMAMSFAPAALYIPGLVIKNVEVVNKSYPGYWNDLEKAGFTIERVEQTKE